MQQLHQLTEVMLLAVGQVHSDKSNTIEQCWIEALFSAYMDKYRTIFWKKIRNILKKHISKHKKNHGINQLIN